MCRTMTNISLNFMIDGLWFGLVCTYTNKYHPCRIIPAQPETLALI